MSSIICSLFKVCLELASHSFDMAATAEAGDRKDCLFLRAPSFLGDADKLEDAQERTSGMRRRG